MSITKTTQGGSTLTFAGGLTNSGLFSIGSSNNSLTSDTTVKAASVVNTGTLEIFGTLTGNVLATLDITGAAGFGTAGVVTGQVYLGGDALLEFGSGQITSIQAGALARPYRARSHRRMRAVPRPTPP